MNKIHFHALCILLAFMLSVSGCDDSDEAITGGHLTSENREDGLGSDILDAGKGQSDDDASANRPTYDLPDIGDTFTYIDLDAFLTLLSLDPKISNEDLLKTYFGWEDPLDYSQLKRHENKDADGKVFRIYYTYDSEEAVGWTTTLLASKDEVSYVYSYPGETVSDGNKFFQINRLGTLDDSDFQSVNITNLYRGYRVNFYYSREGDRHLERLNQQRDDLRDGIQATATSQSNYEYQAFANNRHISTCRYENKQLTFMKLMDYDGEDIIGHEYTFFNNGNPRNIVRTLNNAWDGPQSFYYDNGQLREEFYHLGEERNGTQKKYTNEGDLVYTYVWYKGEKTEAITPDYYNKQ